MRKLILLPILLFAFTTQQLKAQTSENDVIKTTIGGMMAGYLTSAYSSINNSVKKIMNDDIHRDSALMSLAYTVAMLQTTSPEIEKLSELDFFDEEDKLFVKEATEVIESLRKQGQSYLDYMENKSGATLDKYFKNKAAARTLLFNMLEMDEKLEF